MRHETSAARRPVGAAIGEAVFHHPFEERLADDRPCVLDPEPRGDAFAVAVGGARDDAVDHRVREGAMRFDPVAQPGVDLPSEGEHDAARGVAVGGQVVAGHHRDRREAAGTAQGERMHHEAGHGARCLRVREVVSDVGRVEPKRAGGRVVVVAFLGDGEAHDACVGVCDAFQHGLRVLGRDQHLEQVAHHLQRFARRAVLRGIAQRQRVEAALRLQCVARVGRAQRNAHRAPVQVAARMQRGFVDDRDVRTVERTHAEVDDAGTQRVAPVARPCHVGGQAGQGVGVQGLHDSRAHQFQSVPSCCRRFTGR